MSANDLSHAQEATTRPRVCVVIVGHRGDVAGCVESVRAHTSPDTPIVTATADTAALNAALVEARPADVALLLEPCRVTDGWLERLRSAAHEDTNTATASALADADSALALGTERASTYEELAEGVARHTPRLRPRLLRAVGPCVYVRRDALELVGALDEEQQPRWAVEVDFAQRCLLWGLGHVAADDVVVAQLSLKGSRGLGEVPQRLRERYPYLPPLPAVAASAVLPHTLELVRPPRARLSVTIDARAVEGFVTGTQIHILELIRALAHTGALRLRVLVRQDKIGGAALELLRALPETELLDEQDVGERTPKSTVVHRPQQTFAAEDVSIVLRLGEHVVLSQLDLIAYHNPGYFGDAGAWAAYRRASRHGMSAAERVVVFSEHTRRELLSDALVDAERIRIIPPGLDHGGSEQPRQPQALMARSAGSGADGGGEAPYLLCLGTDFRHKNRVFALRLLAALRARELWSGRLVFAGTHVPHGSSRELEQAAREQQPELRDSVIDLGSVTEAEKAWLIDNAAAVVYPSVYEGFGLVPFEAALRGVPCLFAAQSALADVAPADTAAIVPWDPARSAERTHALLSHPRARSQHVEALAAIASQLTWAKTASAMVAAYREAAAAPVRDAATLSRDAVARERELTAAHEEVVLRLIGEREHAKGMYDELNAEVGWGLSLIGPHGALPQNLQRALLTLSARPTVSRPLFGALASLFAFARACAHTFRGLLRRAR
jgi:glycosyltransferase involved in cell wall biosynthesis